ncbi:MAG: TolC family protein [Planctomycetota bacterium]
MTKSAPNFPTIAFTAICVALVAGGLLIAQQTTDSPPRSNPVQQASQQDVTRSDTDLLEQRLRQSLEGRQPASSQQGGPQRIVNPLAVEAEQAASAPAAIDNARAAELPWNNQPSQFSHLPGYVRGYEEPEEILTGDVPLIQPGQEDVTPPWMQDVARAHLERDPDESEFANLFENAYSVLDDSAVEEVPAAHLAEDDDLFITDAGFPTAQADEPDVVQGAIEPDNTAPPELTFGGGDFSGEDFSSSGEFATRQFSHSESPTAGLSFYDDGELLWWKPMVLQPLNASNQTQQADTNVIVYQALRNSPRIQAISRNPLLRELQIAEARAEFDPVQFLRTQWDDRNDPVGNELTTGNGELFLRDNIWSATGGLRQKMIGGGNVELSQRVGFQNSNSRFFTPQDQGTATLALNFSQPLLRGRGRFFNTSQILIAQTATGAEWETFQAELQNELQSVVEAYWQLYYERSVFLQKKRNVVRGQEILELLEGRMGLDALPNQVARARSAVLSRRTSLANAFRDVRNSETELRRLMADPNWLANQSIELLPVEAAVRSDWNIPLENVIYSAMENRPEIKESIRRAKVAAIQHDISRNELLPELSLLLNTYASALEGDSGIERALVNQFSNSLGYSVGFEFEFPVNNRAARSRLAQRKVQKSKIEHEVHEVLQNVIAEGQVAHRRLISAYQTMDAAKVAIEAARADLDQNRRRWETFALIEGDLADGQTPTTVLDQLLDSQDRLASAELVYAQSELELKLSEIGLRRAQGTLLMHEQVVFDRVNYGDVPDLHITPARSQVGPNSADSTPGYQIHPEGQIQADGLPAGQPGYPVDMMPEATYPPATFPQGAPVQESYPSDVAPPALYPSDSVFVAPDQGYVAPGQGYVAPDQGYIEEPPLPPLNQEFGEHQLGLPNGN